MIATMARQRSFSWTSHLIFVEIWDMRHDMWWTIQKCIQILKIEKIFQIRLYAVFSGSVLRVQLAVLLTVFGFIVKEFWMTMLSTIKCRHKIQMQRWNTIDNANLSCILSHSTFGIRNSKFTVELQFFDILVKIEHWKSNASQYLDPHLFRALFICKSIVVHSISSLNTEYQ